MADRLTQLQDCLDQLASQFYASIRYISTHHPPSALSPNQPLPPASPTLDATINPTNVPIPNSNLNNNNIPPPNLNPALTPISNPPISNPADPSVTPSAATAAAATANNLNAVVPSQSGMADLAPPSEPPMSLESAQKELARDLLIKTRQITYLVSVLPGVENSEAQQEQRIRELEKELREAEMEREDAVREMEAWRGKLESVIGGVRR